MEPIVFFSDENMTLFWEYTKTLLSTVSPGIMISVAVVGVGLLLQIVVKAWKQAASPKNDDDDFDYKEF